MYLDMYMSLVFVDVPRITLIEGFREPMLHTSFFELYLTEYRVYYFFIVKNVIL